MFWLALVAQDSIGWRTDYEDASKIARENRQLLLVHFWKPEQVELEALSDPVVIARSVHFVCLRINGLRDDALAAYFGATELPTTLVATSDGKKLLEMRGRTTAERLASVMGAYIEHYPKVSKAQGKELFEAHWALEDWGSAAETLEKIGPKDDPAWYHTRRIDLALRRASRANPKALREASDAAKGIAGLEDDVAAVEALLSLSIETAVAARAKWPESNRDDVFLMVIAAGYLKQDKKSEARPYLEELAKKHPHSDYGRWAGGLLK